MSIEDRFKAAVNVIKGLPPKGTYILKNILLIRRIKKKWQSISIGKA